MAVFDRFEIRFVIPSSLPSLPPSPLLVSLPSLPSPPVVADLFSLATAHMIVSIALLAASTFYLSPTLLLPSPSPRGLAYLCSSPDPLDSFLSSLSSSLDSKRFIKLTLSGTAKPAPPPSPPPPPHLQQLNRVNGRLVSLKGGVRLQLTLKYSHRDATYNLPLSGVEQGLRDFIGPSACRNARLFASDGDLELAFSRRGVGRLIRQKPALASSGPTLHDKPKARAVSRSEPFLVSLGVTNPKGQPKQGMAAKLRQIDRFVQTIASLVGPPPEGKTAPSLRVFDLGCGRGYLTFAAHAHLQRVGWEVRTVGVELRPAIVEEVEGIARRLGEGFDGLSFREGAIASLLPMPAVPPREERDVEGGGEPEEEKSEGKRRGLVVGERGGVDVLIALHACDTATDDALWCGISRGAKLLLTAPCCHKEVRRQMDRFLGSEEAGSIRLEGAEGEVRGEHALAPLLRHGIFRERTAEMATDSARALLLELAGYDVKVFEFVGGEHTAKNVMIAATLRSSGRSEGEREAIRQRLRQQLAMLGVRRQRLADWMGELPSLTS